MAEFFKYIKVNNYVIKLEKNKQPLFKSIYSLKSIELKIIKTYIKTNIANSFIQSSKFFIKVSILFNKKPNTSPHLYIDY